MKCSDCNNQIPDGMSVCPYCSVAATVEKRVCPSCKTPAEANAKFCRTCGTPIPSLDIPKPPVPVNETSATKKNNTVLMIIIAVMAVVIIALLFCLLRNQPSEEIHTAQTEETAGFEESYDNEAELEDAEESNDSDTYLFRSDIYVIDDSVLYGKSQQEVALIRNEIYARHGYIFSNPVYIEYFSKKSWYMPNSDFNENLLSDIEKRNKDFIVEYEKARGWR